MLQVTGIGQDSHAFVGEDQASKPLKLGGVVIPKEPGLSGNSDADVLLHALCNAISSISGKPFLGPDTDAMCQRGITDSAEYLKAQLAQTRLRLEHIAISIEAKKPKLLPWIPAISSRIAEITGISATQVGITATSGEGLTSCGRGEGIMATVILNAWKQPLNDAPLVVLVSCPDMACAASIAELLVKEQLAACVQRVPIDSSYTWQGRIIHEGEILLLIKTRQHCYAELESRVVAEHPYQVPQIIAMPIAAGLPEYLDWIMKR